MQMKSGVAALKARQKALLHVEGEVSITAQYKKALVGVSKTLCENNIWNAFTTILTLYALFGDDLRLVLTSKSVRQRTRPQSSPHHIFTMILITHIF